MTSKMGRPRLDDPNVISKGVKLNKVMVEKIEREASKKGITFSQVIRNALEKYFK